MVSAIRYAVVDKPHAVDAALAPSILTFLLLMGDTDRHVRKAAVVALSAAAHQKVSASAQPCIKGGQSRTAACATTPLNQAMS